MRVPPAHTPPLAGRSVAVVGAGLAGLRAASLLRAAGARVSVVEERAEVGGKVSSCPGRDAWADRSLQLLLFEDRRLISWIRELGLGPSLLPLRPVGSAQLHAGRMTPTSAEGLGAIGRTPGVRWRDRPRLLRLPRLMRRYGPLLDPERPELAEDLDYRSVRDFAQLYFGRSVLDRFVAPRVTAEHLGSEEELSRVAFLLHWQVSRQGAARPGVPTGGLDQVAAAAAAELDVRTGSRAEQLKESASGGLSLECSDQVVEHDAVVLATSAAEAVRLAAAVVTPAERDFLAGVRSGPLVTLTATSSRPLTGLPQHVRVPHVEESPLEVALVEPGVPGGRAPDGGARVTVCARQAFAERYAREPDERLEAVLLAALEQMLPALGRSLEATALHRDPSGVPRFEVGAYRSLARFQRVQQDRRRLGRRLYFAGDYLAGPRLEDAVASGARAATAIVSDLC